MSRIRLAGCFFVFTLVTACGARGIGWLDDWEEGGGASSSGTGGSGAASSSGSGGSGAASSSGTGGSGAASSSGTGGSGATSSSGTGGSGATSSSGTGGSGAASSSGTGGSGAASSSGTGGSGAASSSGSGGNTGGFGGGTAGAGGEPGPLENCTNSMDDDGDGDVDCADPDCDAGYTCAPIAPAGWSGPVALWQGAGSSNPPSCSSAGGYPTEAANANAGLSAMAAVCPGCSCGAPKGVSCQVAAASFYGNNSCAGGAGSLNIVQGICQGFISLSLDPSSVSWKSATSGGGACLPIPSSLPIVPPLEWASRARLCSNPVVGGGCWAAACVPKPDPPFAQSVCVFQSGDVSCPSNYNQKLVYYQGAIDSRSCTGCDCQPPSGTSCAGTLKLWTDLNCQADETTLTSVGQCAQLGPDPTPPAPPYQTLRSIRYTGGPSGSGSCASLPSTTVGSASPSAPITFCCTSI